MPSLVGAFDNRCRHRFAIVFAVVVLLSVWSSALAQSSAEDTGQLWTPAELERAVRLPGEGDQIARPSALYMDRRHGELYVADPAVNRVVVFDAQGLYRFEFDCAGQFASLREIVVDSEGWIYVLGSSPSGDRLVRYDFDGVFLSDFPIEPERIALIDTITIDEQDRLYLLDRNGTVTIVDREARMLREFSVLDAVPDERMRRELLLGSPVVSGGEFLVPASTLGTVLVFDASTGDFLRAIGVLGGNPTEFSFPVAVDVTSTGLVAVLDKMRFVVVFLTLDGRPLGEFGGMGVRDGWFYHPSLMVAVDEDRLVVGQILDGRIQICRIPAFVQSRLVRDRASLRGVDGKTVRPHIGAEAEALALETVKEADIR
jgi:hypothetical protein